MYVCEREEYLHVQALIAQPSVKGFDIAVLHRLGRPDEVELYAVLICLTSEDFVAQAWSLVGRKVHKAALLAEIYAAAQRSIALPVTPDSAAVVMLRLVLEEYLALGRMRESIAQQAEIILASNPDRRRLMTVPGVGPLTALRILAEAGDPRRFAHYRQFLKFCGMSLSTQQSGRFRGISRLSKYGNARCARRSGWRPRPRCACARTVCAASSIVTCVLTRWMLICAARRIARSLPSSHASSMD